jgi:sialate O-acetylesterase
MSPKSAPVALFLLSLTAFESKAEVVLPKVFASHMVLQREIPVPVWGTAAPGETFTVNFRNQSKPVQADPEGKWRVVLDPLAAGGPDVLKVGGKVLEDVLVGEVWVGSGQSNMAMYTSQYVAGDAPLAERAAATYPQLRLLPSGGGAVWQEANPGNNAQFSALLFAFGQNLQARLGVPVGLIVGAVGGTPSGFWLSEDMYRTDAACQEMVRKVAPTYDYDGLKRKYDEEKAKWDVAMTEWKRAEAEAKAAGNTPPRPPAAPRSIGKAGEANSGKIGSLFETFIRPYVGFAIRGVLWDQGESKTNIAGVDQYALMGALIKGWRKEWGQDFPFLYVQKPSGGGCAWDPSNPVNAKAEKFVAQPAQVPRNPLEADADYCHELHLRLMDYPKTFMVTATDLGGGVHPVLKSAYGLRASQVAIGAVYGGKEPIYGPMYTSHAVEGSSVRLQFTHKGAGLAAAHQSALQGFLVAGSDRRFVWADAKIEGDAVVVSSPAVGQPVAVRYAWAGAFPWANLFNKNGLPAQPFRTDRW